MTKGQSLHEKSQTKSESLYENHDLATCNALDTNHACSLILAIALYIEWNAKCLYVPNTVWQHLKASKEIAI